MPISLTSGNNLPAKDASHSVCIHRCFFHGNSVSLNPHSSFLLFGEDSRAVGWNEHRLLVLFIRPSVPSGLLSLQEAVGTTYIFQPAESCLCVRQKLTGDSEILPSVISPFRVALLPSSLVLCHVSGVIQCGDGCICWPNVISGVPTSRLRCRVSGWVFCVLNMKL